MFNAGSTQALALKKELSIFMNDIKSLPADSCLEKVIEQEHKEKLNNIFSQAHL